MNTIRVESMKNSIFQSTLDIVLISNTVCLQQFVLNAGSSDGKMSKALEMFVIARLYFYCKHTTLYKLKFFV